ncbi:DUF397 domain-containing protein [Streptomyces sp. NPDC097640]|uniref:DUF397 domain-containing protein n=1 Tax=Streptomyces sp. NPDC097640 TaxID=3157229 RepID=UPI003328ADE9
MTPEAIGPYRKSSYSGGENNCVEIADMSNNGRAVRDSKAQRGPHLTFTGGAWQAFLLSVKRRDFDR